MLGALLGLLLAALDQTIVSTAGPKIQKDLQIEPALYVWITSAYLVASTVLVPIYGKMSDLYGRRRILLISVIIFLAGSLLCGISQTSMQLIAARAVQGVGSAGLFTSAFAVVADLFPPAERGKWQGLFGAAFGVSSVIGPLLGGFITDQFGWHWAFFINLPLGLVAIAFIVFYMPPLRFTDGQPRELDIGGALALATAVLPMLFGLSLGHSATREAPGWPWMSWQIFVLFGISLVGIVAFVFVEERAESPILDLRLFKIKTFAIGALATFVVGGAFLGAIVYLPLFMVNVVGLSSTSSGLTTVPLTFGIVAANITTGQLVSRLGAYKGLLLCSLVILAAACLLLAMTLTPDATQLSVSAKMVVLGIGLGPSIPLYTLAMQTSVPPQQIGVATAAATFFRQMGSTIGIAIVGTAFATSFAGVVQIEMPTAVADVPAEMRAQFQPQHEVVSDDDPRVGFDAKKITAKIDQSIDKSPMSRPQKALAKEQAHVTIVRVDRVFKGAYTAGLVDLFWISLVIAILGLSITILLPQLPLRTEPPGARPPIAE